MKKSAAVLGVLFLAAFAGFADENNTGYLIPHTDFFVPSLRAGVINTFEDANHYFGGGLRVNFVSFVTEDYDDDERFPAFVDWFVEVNLYRDPDLPQWAFDYLMGITVSLERARPQIRDWLLPYYGVKFGGIYLSEDHKSGFVLLPFIGVSVFRRRNFYLDLEVAILLGSTDFKHMVSYEPSLAFGFSY
ncbi:MAG: hypothetical protein LBJ31_05885 [Treponema sp.]|nr:hypothetical protein [Treponema sp.]